MKPKVLITYAGHKEVMEELEVLDEAGAEVVAADFIDSPLALETMPSADAMMVTVQKVTGEIMDRMPNCRIICRIGTGMDAIDIPAATERGIWVTNVPDYSIDEVSAHAMALLLSLARSIPRHRELARTGTWRYQVDRPIRRLNLQTLGVIGLGRIGKASAAKGRGLGMRVIAYDPYLDDRVFAEAGVERVDLDTLLQTSDFVTLHVPLTPETRQMIGAAELAKMKPTAFLINTARGEVLDVPAVVEAVRNDTIAGAGIDVLPVEPPDPNDPVLYEDRIIVTPHIAWASTESGIDVRRRGAEDVARVLRGEAPKYPWNEVPVKPALLGS